MTPPEPEKNRVPFEVLKRTGLLGELSADALRSSPDDDGDEAPAAAPAADEEAEPALP